MELTAEQGGLLREYIRQFETLIGDKRTQVAFKEVVRGIISAGSLVCQRIAAHSAVLSAVKDGAQRVIRLARGESTQRSRLDAESLTGVLRAGGIRRLSEAEGDELWLILDSSDLRKPYAQEMPSLMQVRDLDGDLVPGYRTLNVLGVTPQRRGILYHRLFSSQEAGFVSEPSEVQTGLRTVSQALQGLKERLAVTWIMDSGLDDIAVWRTIWEQAEHLVCRLRHSERLVEYQNEQGQWVAGDIQRASEHGRLLATAQSEMLVRRGSQKRAKRQQVPVEIWVCSIRLTYETQGRYTASSGGTSQKLLWLVEVRLPKTDLDPWLLITDWPVTEPDHAVRIFRMYRQRWAVEDSFKFVKDSLGWEEVQLLDLRGIRTLVALGWVAAAFLYDLGVTLEWQEVHLLARLGGWSARPDRPPGKIVLTRGLRRLADMLTTQAFLNRYVADHGSLPPGITNLLQDMGDDS
jgi:hypothetical protein